MSCWYHAPRPISKRSGTKSSVSTMLRCGSIRSTSSDSRNVDRLAEACADTEILVNNAGAIPGGNIDAIDEARWRTAWDLKVFGYVNMTRRFYALMRGARRASSSTSSAPPARTPISITSPAPRETHR